MTPVADYAETTNIRRFATTAELLAWTPRHDGKLARSLETTPPRDFRYYAEQGWVEQTNTGAVQTLVDESLSTIPLPNSTVVRTADPLPGDGIDGDGWINATSGNVFEKLGGAWVIVANITGPAGSTGPVGQVGLAMAIVFGAP